MATKIADVIVPEVFNSYLINRTFERSELFQSGIVATVPGLSILAQNGGDTITMPFWNDLTGAEEILSDTVPLTPAKITAATDAAVLNARGKAWGVHDLAVQLSGSDPMGAVGNLVIEYWNRRMQAQIISMLKGIFANAGMAANRSDISGGTGDAGILSGPSFVDAAFKLGDRYGGLTVMAVHSAALAHLVKGNLIVYSKDSEGNLTIPTYMGLRLIVDDGMPVEGGVYTSYLFGPGAIGYGDSRNPKLPVTETDRDTLLGEDYLINRKYYVLHPRGVRWTGIPAGVSPTNLEFETAASWTRVYDPKQLRIVQFRFRLA